ncbi:MAG: hypothetical protein JNK57_14425 [Planctomycetaceae bacterium]|nr:hypothetical protein [Planctomycetaceae bacterium]
MKFRELCPGVQIVVNGVHCDGKLWCWHNSAKVLQLIGWEIEIAVLPVQFCIVVVPFSVYLLLLGWLHLRKHPFVTTTGRDIAILSVAVSGMMIVGPMELFFPENAVSRFGPFVWLMLLAFYGLLTSLLSMMVRPGLVIYNVREDQIRPLLSDVLIELDKPHWSGENVRLPNLGIHFQIESHPWLRCVQLVSTGRKQNLTGWRLLEAGLQASVVSVPTHSNLYGPLFIALAGLLNVVGVVWMIRQPAEVVAAWQQILRL